jgi:hypothetical protein
MADERLPLNTTGQAIDTPEGKVRNGNRWPYKKASRAEVEARIIFVRGLLSRGLNRFLLRCTDGDPEKRPADAQALLDEFVRVCDDLLKEGREAPAPFGGPVP